MGYYLTEPSKLHSAYLCDVCYISSSCHMHFIRQSIHNDYQVHELGEYCMQGKYACISMHLCHMCDQDIFIWMSSPNALQVICCWRELYGVVSSDLKGHGHGNGSKQLCMGRWIWRMKIICCYYGLKILCFD